MSKVSDILAKDIQIAILKRANIELQVKAQFAELNHIVEELISQARSEVSAPIDHVYDVDSQEFRPQSGPRNIESVSK